MKGSTSNPYTPPKCGAWLFGQFILEGTSQMLRKEADPWCHLPKSESDRFVFVYIEYL